MIIPSRKRVNAGAVLICDRKICLCGNTESVENLQDIVQNVKITKGEFCTK